MDSAQAIHSFWSGFGLPAYDENTTPDNVSFPYITYELTLDNITGGNISLSASLYYKSYSWSEITKKSDEIFKKIGLGGVIIQVDDGVIWIKTGTPFSRRMDEPNDDSIRRVVLNISVEFLTI